jgi:trk system potassium uptake protein TrkA
VEKCHRAGIRIIMTTGDYGLTAESIARRIGIIRGTQPHLLTGADLSTMDDKGLVQALQATFLRGEDVIFARVAPEHKLRVVTALQALGQVVAVTGDGTDPATLEAAGVRHAHVVAAVTGTDETNLVVTSLARFEFDVPRTIARVRSPQNAWMFTPAMGVDVALNQADLLAHLTAEEMSLGDMRTLLKLRKGQYSLVEERVAPAAVAAGKAVRDLHLPTECVLAAIIRQGQLLIPRAEVVLQPGDEVLAVVHASQVSQLAALLGGTE